MTGALGVAERGASIAPSRLRIPGYWRCTITLALAWLALRTAGFARTLRTARSIAERRSTNPVAAVEVCRAARRIAVVAAFFPGRALCLEQSLALYWMLRRQRVAVRLRVGVHPAPFTAHAWIEYESVPVNEDDDRIHELLPLPIDAKEGV